MLFCAKQTLISAVQEFYYNQIRPSMHLLIQQPFRRLIYLALCGVCLLMACQQKQNQNMAMYASNYTDKAVLAQDSAYTFRFTDSLVLGSIGSVIAWKQYILVEDTRALKVWVFDKKLKYITTVGKKGRGPGEFTSSCILTPHGDSLCILDKRLRMIHLYDTNFRYIAQKQLPLEIALHEPPLRFNNHYIVGGLYLGKQKSIEFNQKYTDNNHSLFVIDSTMQITKNIFPWDEQYSNQTHQSFNTSASDVNLSPGLNNTFFAQQKGVYAIAQYDSTMKLVKYFGYKPKELRPPALDEEMKKLNDNRNRSNILFQSTFFHVLRYESVSNTLITYSLTATEESMEKHDFTLAKLGLQVYDATTYDCLFDGRAPGRLLYAEQGRAYFLTEDNAQKFTITAYTLKKK
jgi:hypothetical protein